MSKETVARVRQGARIRRSVSRVQVYLVLCFVLAAAALAWYRGADRLLLPPPVVMASPDVIPASATLKSFSASQPAADPVRLRGSVHKLNRSGASKEGRLAGLAINRSFDKDPDPNVHTSNTHEHGAQPPGTTPDEKTPDEEETAEEDGWETVDDQPDQSAELARLGASERAVFEQVLGVLAEADRTFSGFRSTDDMAERRRMLSDAAQRYKQAEEMLRPLRAKWPDLGILNRSAERARQGVVDCNKSGRS